jgi:hypothetical protein
MRSTLAKALADRSIEAFLCIVAFLFTRRACPSVIPAQAGIHPGSYSSVIPAQAGIHPASCSPSFLRKQESI